MSAFDLMGSLAFYPLGMAVAGPIAAVIGVAGSFAVAGGATVASAAAADRLPDIRGVRRRPSAHRPRAAQRRAGALGAERRLARGRRAAAPPIAYTGRPVSSHSRYSAE